MARQRERRQETRRRMIEAARALFAERGVAATAIRDVAAAAGVVKGTFYYNFSGKDELIIAVAASALGDREGAFERALEGDRSTEALLGDLLDGAAAWTEAHPDLARAVHRIALGRSWQENEARDRPSFRRLTARILARGQARGEVRADIPAPELSVLLMISHVAQSMIWFDEPEPSLRERCRRCLSVFLEGARPRKEGEL